MSENCFEFEHARFGVIEIDETDILHFPGLPGFRGATRFVILEHDRGFEFAWLVSLDEPDLAFIVTDPWQFFPDYDPEVSLNRLNSIDANGASDVEVLVIVNFHEEKITLNLAAPLIMNPNNRQGMQVILEKVEYSVRQPLPELTREFLEARAKASSNPDSPQEAGKEDGESNR